MSDTNVTSVSVTIPNEKEVAMSNELVSAVSAGKWEAAVMDNNLEALSPQERLDLVRKVCETTGLNPITGPLQYIRLSGKLTLYAKRDATDQLRKIHNVSVVITSREVMHDVYVVTAKATMPNGRTDESTGAVALGNLKGEALANAYLKAETKAKRRVTLSICGLGFLDETEVQSIPDAVPVPMESFQSVIPSVKASKAQLDRIVSLHKDSGMGPEYWAEVKTKFSIQSSTALTFEQAESVISDLQAKISEKGGA